MGNQSHFKIGDHVRATTEITEENFNGQSLWIHANEKDTGEVIHVDQKGYPTVRFSRTKTATVVFPLEVQKI